MPPMRVGLGNRILPSFPKPGTCGTYGPYGLALSSLDSGTSHVSRLWHSYCKQPTATLVVGTTRSACLKGTDNSATEASLNKLFATSGPLQLFVQLTAFWAHAHNVLLQPTSCSRRTSVLEAVLLSAIPVKRTAAASDLLCSFGGSCLGSS